jgi:hypothetical protein
MIGDANHFHASRLTCTDDELVVFCLRGARQRLVVALQICKWINLKRAFVKPRTARLCQDLLKIHFGWHMRVSTADVLYQVSQVRTTFPSKLKAARLAPGGLY